MRRVDSGHYAQNYDWRWRECSTFHDRARVQRVEFHRVKYVLEQCRFIPWTLKTILNAGRRLFHFDPDVHTTIKEMNMDTILTNSLLRGERGCWYGKSTQRVGRCIIKSVVLQETPREFRHSLDKYVQSG